MRKFQTISSIGSTFFTLETQIKKADKLLNSSKNIKHL